MDVAALLCDHAEVSGGKLFVNGAGVSLIGTQTPEPPFPTNISLAIVLTVPWTATNEEHRLTVELVSEAVGTPDRIPLVNQLGPGQTEADLGIILALFNVGRSQHLMPGEDTLVPLAIPLTIPLPALGSYFFAIGVDGVAERRVSFRLARPAPVAGAPGQPG